MKLIINIFVYILLIMHSLSFANNNLITLDELKSLDSNVEKLEKLEKNDFRISLPITKKNHDMDFYEWSFQNSLKISYQGIPEPNIKKKVFPDVLIVPICGFDNNKFRLGYGGGFYDRYIQKISKIKKVVKVGLAFSFQKLKTIPVNKHDKKLDIIITEKEII